MGGRVTRVVLLVIKPLPRLLSLSPYVTFLYMVDSLSVVLLSVLDIPLRVCCGRHVSLSLSLNINKYTYILCIIAYLFTAVAVGSGG